MSFNFSDIFAKHSASVLGVDIGSSSIKVVQVRREHGKAVLETYGAVSLGPYAKVEIGRATQLPTEVLTQALKDVVKEANVTTNDACFAIPYSASLVSVVKLPVAAESQLAQVMPMEARKYIPVPLTEVQLDWTQVSGGAGESAVPAGGKIEVMLVAIQNSTIEKYHTIAANAGLNAAFLEIEIFSAVRASLDHGIAPVVVVDFGAATTKCYVVERGVFRESHLINRGSQELTLALARALNITVTQAEERKRKEGLSEVAAQQPNKLTSTAAAVSPDLAHQSFELTLAPLLSEIAHTVTSFEQRMGEAISTIVFTGGGASLRGFAQYAQTKLQAEVRIADPFGKTQTPAFLTQLLKETGPEFAVAVGVALRRLQEM